MATDQSFLTELERRCGELKARATLQQQQLAETMNELHAVNRQIKVFRSAVEKKRRFRLAPPLVVKTNITQEGRAAGGRARMRSMTPEQRSEQGRKGAMARTANRVARRQLLIQAST